MKAEAPAASTAAKAEPPLLPPQVCAIDSPLSPLTNKPCLEVLLWERYHTLRRDEAVIGAK